MFQRKIVLSLSLIACLMPIAHAQWVLDPTNTGSGRQNIGVWFTSAQVGFIAQSVALADGAIIKTTDGGSTWTEKKYITGSELNCFFFLDANTGFCGGDDGTVLKTTNGGETWTTVATSSIISFNHMYFFSELVGYLTTNAGSMYRTDDGFATPVQLQQPTVSGSDVDFPETGTGYAVNYSSMYKTINGGTSWTWHNITIANGLQSVAFGNAYRGVAVGNNGTIIFTDDGGVNWTVVPSGTTENLSDVQFINATTAVVVGSSPNYPNPPVILRSTDGGLTWAPMTNSAQWSLWGLHFPTPTTGFAVGLGDTLLKFSGAIGVEEKPTVNASIGPNPFTAQCTISFVENSVIGQPLVLSDLCGRTISTHTIGADRTVRIPRGDLSAGSYLVHIASPEVSFHRTLVVE